MAPNDHSNVSRPLNFTPQGLATTTHPRIKLSWKAYVDNLSRPNTANTTTPATTTHTANLFTTTSTTTPSSPSTDATPNTRKRKHPSDHHPTTSPTPQSWTKLITLHIGPSSTPFIIHEHILRRIPFFRACLDANMREVAERVVRMPEDSVEAFGMFVGWCYGGRLDGSMEMRTEEGEKRRRGVESGEGEKGVEKGEKSDGEGKSRQSRKMLRLYYFAKKVGAEELQNRVLDEVRGYMEGRCFASWEIALIEKHAEHDDLLRLFALKQVAAFVRGFEGKGWEAFEKGCKIKYKQEEYQSVACFMVEALVRDEELKGRVGERDGEGRCRWHEHLRTEECA